MNREPSSKNTPAELVLARSAAFSRGDFGFIFDSYHSASNFRRLFFVREEYLDYGQLNLGQDYQIISCVVLAEKVEKGEAQVIFLVRMKVMGEDFQYAEHAWLQRENSVWRYHRGQKISGDELPESPHLLGFADFAKLDPATIF